MPPHAIRALCNVTALPCLRLQCGGLQWAQSDMFKLIIQEFKKKNTLLKAQFLLYEIGKSMYQEIRDHLMSWLKIAIQKLSKYICLLSNLYKSPYKYESLSFRAGCANVRTCLWKAEYRWQMQAFVCFPLWTCEHAGCCTALLGLTLQEAASFYQEGVVTRGGSFLLPCAKFIHGSEDNLSW